MTDFKYYTRGNSSPQGKPRVYFTAHPNDYDRYFESIRKELLDRQNCAVFYLDPDVVPGEVEDYELRLGEMQLFVIPVTAELLTQPNRAMDTEVPFALAHHIPVLPLMQDDGLEELFNKRFGDLQFLDKNNTDPTAIPYEEQLTKSLASVIVGDELAEKVRAAFALIIFLSYRKKDRKEAQDLMKLIHANPLFRDVAVWYDEFLIPGENFSSAIMEAIKACKLFVLTITPNLLEMPGGQPNYVMGIEYPAAKELGKPILPAVMRPTDTNELKSKYSGIPEPVSAYQVPALDQPLQQIASAFRLSEKMQMSARDPMHLFFIGLAYLSGIDVEVNHEKAVKLISESAGKGCIAATDKLVTMYENGEGVERDYHKALEWREKLVQQCKAFYETDPDFDAALTIVNNLYLLGDAYRELGQLDSAQRVYEETFIYLGIFSQKYKDNVFVRYRSVTYNKLGELARVQGRLSEAEDYYRKDMKNLEELIKTEDTEVVRRDQSIMYNKLGLVLEAQGKLDEAERCYRKSLEIREEIVEKSDSAQARLDQASSFSKLGRSAKANGKYSEAESYFLKALKMTEVLAVETGWKEARRNLLICCNDLGDLARDRGSISEAKEYYLKGFEIARAIAAETDTIEARIDLSISYERLGDVALSEGNLDEAERFYRKAYEICETIAADTGTAEARHSLMVSCQKVGDIAKEQKNYSEAEKLYRKDMAIGEALAQQTGTLKARLELTIVYQRVADIYELQGKHREAEYYIRKALAINEAIVEETGTAESYDLLAVSYYKLSAILQSREYLEKACAIFGHLAEAYPEVPEYRQRRDLLRHLLEKYFGV